MSVLKRDKETERVYYDGVLRWCIISSHLIPFRFFRNYFKAVRLVRMRCVEEEEKVPGFVLTPTLIHVSAREQVKYSYKFGVLKKQNRKKCRLL